VWVEGLTGTSFNCNNLLAILTGRYKQKGSGRQRTRLFKTNYRHRLTEQNKLNTDTDEHNQVIQIKVIIRTQVMKVN